MSQSTANMRMTFGICGLTKVFMDACRVLVANDGIIGNRFGQEERCPFRNML